MNKTKIAWTERTWNPVTGLMIGDFFLYKDNVVEIVTIDGGTETVWIDGKKVSALRKIDELQPIPLTPEIFEKNGFKQIGKKFIWGEIDDDFIEITQSINSSYRIKVSVADLMIGCSIWCSYVHELQHALKLCGIEKEIEL